MIHYALSIESLLQNFGGDYFQSCSLKTKYFMNQKGEDFMQSKTGRICVTLPVDMLENFRILSEETDLSISRLIYLRLHKREPILLVTEKLLDEVKNLRNLLNDIKLGSYISQENFFVMQERVRQLEELVNLNDPSIVVHVKRR